MRIKKVNLPTGCHLFKALSEDARLRILHLIYRNEEMCISDLEIILDFTQTKTSRHLNYLKNAGLLNSRKQDHWVFYSIKEAMQDIVTSLLTIVDTDPRLVKDQEVFEIMYTNRELALYKSQKNHWRNRHQFDF
ncbi:MULTISPECIES: ArsR/SmtB family transcription factor [Persicobacter]|uniref:HTH arsR-type domain-containing protein n=1 Tax=Persicobacter diffluens TaxID=981 RepID=A0AAN4W1C3_9BACT|nr:metalloregulator ArsR/SmtB family transcription factor [Persicobacter sp. CCB-QB2]GJM62105.1 hypothetical protein PEDI_26570 [Persicobacter diffluens]